MRVLYDNTAIQARIAEVAACIDRDYSGKNLILMGVLTGAFIFTADLARKLTIPCQIDFVRLSSYGNETFSSGEVKACLGCKLPLAGRDILVVEEIVDSGKTLSFLIDGLKNSGAASVKVCTLVDKRGRRESEVEINYSCFTLKDGFLVGYGMDMAETLRNLTYIAVIED